MGFIHFVKTEYGLITEISTRYRMADCDHSEMVKKILTQYLWFYIKKL